MAERGLLPAAVSALTAHALADLPFESLGPTKALLKRYFSDQPWGESEEAALAEAVGAGEGWWRQRLDEDLVLEFGWVDGRLALGVQGPAEPSPEAEADAGEREGLEATFGGPIVPEATPNPRTLAFRTGPIHDGESRSYDSAGYADDPRVARLFRSVPDLATVLVAKDFVALTLRRPDRWEAVLVPVLSILTEEFGAGEGGSVPPAPRPSGVAASGPSAGTRAAQRETRLDRAWRELGGLRPDEPAELERLRAAASSRDIAHRQVAATLLGQAPAEVAGAEWARLVGDQSRTVRRSAVDAVVDARREDLRPLLERALSDADAWVRWKALRGLVELGSTASLGAIRPLAADPDFRVRLEAQAALGPR